jgi:dolichyl-phosphate-mannose--protein O-mannosyl transferase
MGRGVLAGVGLGVLFLWHIIKERLWQQRGKFLRLIGFCLVFFVVIPLAIYILSYLPVVTDPPSGSLIQTVIDDTTAIFNYHQYRETEPIPYISPAYSWPTMRTPVLFDITGGWGDSDLVVAIFCLGNPVIWWCGIPCILFCFYRFLWKKDGKAAFLVVAYLAQYLPWVVFLQVEFLYHYFPAALFMFLMIGYTLQMIADWKPWGLWAVGGFLAAAVVVFFIFYPVISGYPTSLEYPLSLRWQKDWFPDHWFPWLGE